MKTTVGLMAAIASLCMAAIPMKSEAQPRLDVQLEIGASPVSRYYASLGEKYDVPYHDICLMHEAGVVDEDMPQILYIYTHSQYSLRQIYSLRLRGATWGQLSNWCSVPLYEDHNGPPYGNAYGYHRNGPGRHWNGPGRPNGEGDRQHDRWSDEQRGRGRFQEDR